jgi:hypothetical protein
MHSSADLVNMHETIIPTTDPDPLRTQTPHPFHNLNSDPLSNPDSQEDDRNQRLFQPCPGRYVDQVLLSKETERARYSFRYVQLVKVRSKIFLALRTWLISTAQRALLLRRDHPHNLSSNFYLDYLTETVTCIWTSPVIELVVGGGGWWEHLGL